MSEPILNENENVIEPNGPKKEEPKGFRAFLSTAKGKVIFGFSVAAVCLALGCGMFFLTGGENFFRPSQNPPPVSTTENKETTSENTEETLGDEKFTETLEILPAQEDDEMRGVYIATVNNINFPSGSGLSEEQLKKELESIVSVSRSAGLDTLFFQVRPTADALYPSEIFPSSRFLMKKEGEPMTFDPFQYLIDEASKFEMKVVAWVNPYRITNSKADDKDAAIATLSENHPAKLNPQWTVFYDGKLYFNPAVPEVQDLITSGVEEICRNYDVEGVIYDDYFYPYVKSCAVFFLFTEVEQLLYGDIACIFGVACSCCNGALEPAGMNFGIIGVVKLLVVAKESIQNCVFVRVMTFTYTADFVSEVLFVNENVAPFVLGVKSELNLFVSFCYLVAILNEYGGVKGNILNGNAIVLIVNHYVVTEFKIVLPVI